jgi:hypothetical protein
MNSSVDLEDSHFNTLHQFEHGVSSTVEVRNVSSVGSQIDEKLSRLTAHLQRGFLGVSFNRNQEARWAVLRTAESG